LKKNIQLLRERSRVRLRMISRDHDLCRLWAWRRKVLVLSVYRYDNAALLNRIVHDAQKNMWDVSLWALDQAHPLLHPYSLGTGKSPKFPLLNQLIGEKDLSQFDWVVVTDDDVLFEQGSLAAFLYMAERAGLALAQPAHAVNSFSNHEITLWHPHTIARLTTFVEIGPLFAIQRDYYDKFLPFPERSGMGWGLDVEWSDLHASGVRLGIIDWVTVRHLAPAATNYDVAQQEKHLREVLQVRGQQYVSHLQHNLAAWHEWESRPPWLCAAK
jgi:hypothetical protein